MVDLLTDIGEEWYTENDVGSFTVTIGLYNDATDALTDSSTSSDITTEPSGSAYAPQSDTVTSTQISGNYGIQNDSLISFDTSDSSQTVDAGYIEVTFTSDTVAGDSGDTQHLVAAGDLTQSRDLSQIDTLEISAGELTVTVD